jgi:universal stress protein A
MKIKPMDRTGGVIVELGRNEPQLPAVNLSKTTPTLPALELRKILVPVDFTECTQKALQYAVAFARQFGAELTLLHVMEPAYVPASEMGFIADMDSDEGAEGELRSLRSRLGREVRCQTLLRKGGAQYEIIAVAKELGCDLIILSTHGRSGLERLLLGSTAEKVVRHAGCPLLVVRENEHEFVAGRQLETQVDNTVETEAIETAMTTGL